MHLNLWLTPVNRVWPLFYVMSLWYQGNRIIFHYCVTIVVYSILYLSLYIKCMIQHVSVVSLMLINLRTTLGNDWQLGHLYFCNLYKMLQCSLPFYH